MLYIVRHGRTRENALGLLLGHSDPSLDELGLRQAATTAATIGGIRRVVSSPLRRARETADAFGVPVRIDERWIELDYGEFDGWSRTEVPVDTWTSWRSDLDWAPAGGESLRELGERVRSGCLELAEEARSENIVVVTHVSPIKAAFAWALGVGDEVGWRCFVATGSVTRIGTTESDPILLGFNDVTHLQDLGG